MVLGLYQKVNLANLSGYNKEVGKLTVGLERIKKGKFDRGQEQGQEQKEYAMQIAWGSVLPIFDKDKFRNQMISLVILA